MSLPEPTWLDRHTSEGTKLFFGYFGLPILLLSVVVGGGAFLVHTNNKNEAQRQETLNKNANKVLVENKLSPILIDAFEQNGVCGRNGRAGNNYGATFTALDADKNVVKGLVCANGKDVKLVIPAP